MVVVTMKTIIGLSVIGLFCLVMLALKVSEKITDFKNRKR